MKDKNIDELEIAFFLHYLKHVCTLSDDEMKTKVMEK